MINNIRKKVIGLCCVLAITAGINMTLPKSAHALEPFIGQIQTFGFNFAPRGWALCEGQLLEISSNTALFSLLGTTYGGDGRTTFGLPDLRGRAAIGMGQGPGLSNIQIGARGGNENHTLTVNQLPNHTHALMASSANGTTDTPGTDTVLAKKARTKVYSTNPPNVSLKANSVSSTGGSQSFNIRNPYLGINYSIALTGRFPSRS